MIRAISFAMYVVAPCVGVVGTRWALEWLAPGLSHPVKVALTIPPFILIMGTWPWPLPFWMTWDWVLHGSRANSIELMEMKRAESVITVFLLPILFLNFLSGIVGGVWLATIGQWFILATGLFLTLIGWFLVSLVLAPWYLLVTAVCAHQRLASSPPAMMILAILSYGYTVGVMGISAIGVFWYFTLHASSGAVVPTLLWSYSTAVGIWVTLARGGRDNSTVNTLFFHQVGCIFLMVYSYSNFELPSVEMMVPWYAVPMAIGLPIHVFMAFSTTQVEYP